MKRCSILLIALLYGLVIPCGSQQAKPSAKPTAPPAQTLTLVPQVPQPPVVCSGDSFLSIDDVDGSGIPDW